MTVEPEKKRYGMTVQACRPGSGNKMTMKEYYKKVKNIKDKHDI